MNIQEIYDRYGGKIFGYLVMKLGSHSDAEDVFQEVFLRLARHSLRRRLVRNQRAYVIKAACNEANRFLENRVRDRAGTRQVQDSQEAIRSAIHGPSPEEEALAAGALARIPAEQREVIVLKIFEGLTFREIGTVCGLPPNTAASRYRNGIEKLRALLEESR
jgi:RNA polymerase sigma-70 factor (ECF subfamily)